MHDWRGILESLIRQSLTHGASEADAVWFENVDISLSCRKGALEGLERSESCAFTLRCFVGDRYAMVSSTDISTRSLSSLAEHAVGMAKAAPPDALTRLADPSLYPSSLPTLDLCEPTEPSSDILFACAQEAEATALHVPGITNSEGADASHSRSTIGLMAAPGGAIRFAESYATSHSSVSVSVLAGVGVDMQRDYDFSTARYYADLKTPATLGRSAAERAVRRLHPKKIKGGTMPVIYDRRVSRQLLSSFASAINGHHIVRGSSFLRGDMGKAVFSSGITIVDEPHRVRGLASKPFDAEAIATASRTLIDKGVLQSWLLDLRSANALKLAPTGHATRGMGGAPSPSTTNLTMLAGTDSLASLIGSIDYGLLITETFGTGINTITGDYSQGASGFLIERGEVTHPVAEITIAGDLRGMFARMVAADDLMFDYATNAPSLYIDGMAIAGA